MVYGPAFAAVYAREWTDFARRVAPAVVRFLDRTVRHGLVLDLGCGAGTLAGRLLAAGYDVWGVDASPWMLAQARHTAPRATFRCGDLRRAALPACDAAVSTYDTLNYLARAELRRLFRRVRAALRSDGVFIFDLVTPPDLRRPPNPNRFAKLGRDFAVVVIARPSGRNPS